MIHTNFLITNCGQDKWTRALDEKNISIQFYKVPIDDLWIDDSHITDYDGWSRDEYLFEFMKILRRRGYPEERNDYETVYRDPEWGDMTERCIEDGDDCKDFMYRKTLDFPNYPDECEILESYLFPLPWTSSNVKEIKIKLSVLEPYQAVQAILCFRTSYQITSGK